MTLSPLRRTFALCLLVLGLALPDLSHAAGKSDEKSPASPTTPPQKTEADANNAVTQKNQRAAKAAPAKSAQEDPEKAKSKGSGAADRTEALTRRLRPSIVTVRQQGRDGDTVGTGTGFIVASDGLIATNLHVIGEGRPAEVELADGRVFPVTEIHAWDRRLDLAVVRIDAEGLPAAPLGDSDQLAQGQPIVAFGNPYGLTFSVVRGVASAMRDHFEGDDGARVDFGYPMIQLAIPIEVGNSGGPVVDMEGRVHGVVTIKWLVTDNLGFAVPVNALKPLLEKPNPVPIDRWQTIGRLNPQRWEPLMGADWSQRSGVISVRGAGHGFGGRSLCLSAEAQNGAPYEVAVEVRLDDESGAAGLAFASDGDQRHYGFYPSGGQLRLTRFDGPDIYTWTILEQIDTEAYRPGEWNRLRIRIEDEMLTGFVNGEQVVQIRDDLLRGSRVGLCKFRQTEADFRHFRIGDDLSPRAIDEDLLSALERQVRSLGRGRETDKKIYQSLAREPDASRDLLETEAQALEARAAKLRALQVELHARNLRQRFADLFSDANSEPDLLAAGLLIAKLDDPDLDIEAYHEEFARFVDDARQASSDIEGDRERVHRLREFFFDENGFHGSRSEYYHHANSYLNQVLDDREGLPITLSVLFMETARHLGIPHVKGLPLPGHFMVQYAPPGEEAVYIDVFDQGKIVSPLEAAGMVMSITGRSLAPEHLEPAPRKDIALRMLRNLINLEMEAGKPEGARDYIEFILAIEPDAPRERFSRALLRFQAKDVEGTKEDLEWLLENRPPGIRLDRIQQLYEQL